MRLLVSCHRPPSRGLPLVALDIVDFNQDKQNDVPGGYTNKYSVSFAIYKAETLVSDQNDLEYTNW